MKREHKFRRLCSLCEVSLFVAPRRSVDLAAERTDGMVSMFTLAGRSGQHWMDDLRTVVRSAYLQGVSDAAEAMAMTIGQARP